MNIGQLTATVGIDTSPLEQGVKTIGSQFKEVQNTAITAGGAMSDAMSGLSLELQKAKVNLGGLHEELASAMNPADIKEIQEAIRSTETAINGMVGELRGAAQASTDMGATTVESLARVQAALEVEKQKYRELSEQYTTMSGEALQGHSQRMVTQKNVMKGLAAEEAVLKSQIKAAQAKAILHKQHSEESTKQMTDQLSLLDSLSLRLKQEQEDYAELKARAADTRNPRELHVYNMRLKESASMIEAIKRRLWDVKQVSQMTLGEMKQQLKELNKTDFSILPPAKLQEIEHRMKSLTLAIKAQTATTKQGSSFMTTLSQSVRGLSGGMRGITTMVGMFGGEMAGTNKVLQSFVSMSRGATMASMVFQKGQLSAVMASIKSTTALITQAAVTKGYALATTGATVVTRLFGAALKALPLMWIVAGIAAVVAGITALVSWLMKKDKLMEKIKKAYEETSKTMAATTVTLGKYQKIITETHKTELQRTEAVEEYNKVAEEQGLFTIGVNKTIEEQNALMNLNISLLKERAKVAAVEQVTQELRTELVMEELKLESLLEIAKTDTSDAVMVGIAQQKTKIREVEKEIARAEELAEKYKDISKTQDLIAASQKQREDIDKKRKESQDNLNKLLEEEKNKNKQAADEWRRKMEEAAKLYMEIEKLAMTQQQLLEHHYLIDLARYKELYNSKLWTYEQFIRATALRHNQYVNDTVSMELKMAQEQAKILRDKEAVELESLNKMRQAREQWHADRVAEYQHDQNVRRQNLEMILTDESLNYSERLELLKEFHAAGNLSNQLYEEGLKRLAETTNAWGAEFNNLAQNIVPQFADAMGMMFVDAQKGFEAMVGSMLGGISQLINALLAKAMASMIAGEAVKGLPGLITAAVGVGALKALWSQHVSGLQGLATGGVVTSGGMFRVGEEGEEDVYLPKGAAVVPNHMIGGGGAETLRAVISGRDLQIILDRNSAQQQRR